VIRAWLFAAEFLADELETVETRVWEASARSRSRRR